MRRRKMVWEWTRRAHDIGAELGDPTTGSGMVLCVHDQQGTEWSVVSALRIDGGQSCANRACWRQRGGRGFRYRDPDRAVHGVSSIRIGRGVGAPAQIVWKAKGESFPSPALPFAQSGEVVVQLHSDGGGCWETRHADPAAHNDGERFRDLVAP